MQLVRDVEALRTVTAGWRRSGERVALVPTMGALHEGHLSLVRQAAARADHVVASIFVNPRQFGPAEDLTRYPRREAEDCAALEALGVDLVFVPSVATMYPPGFASHVSVAKLGDGLEGAVRPGHFDGVATVVCKLLTMAQPDLAIFGEKDWQQLAIIRRMVADLDLPVEILAGAIVRDSDGLALSSRNVYLNAEQRAKALALQRELARAAHAISTGSPVSTIVSECIAALLLAGFAKVDYLSLANADTLEPLEQLRSPARLLAAATMGTTRLLDNLAVEPRA